MDRRRFLKSATGCVGALSLARLPAIVEAVQPQTDTSAIFFNQLGYLPSRSKIATIRERGNFFTIRSQHDNNVAHHAALSAAAFDAASGDWVQKADFSALKTPGQYTLQLDSGSTSSPFTISNDMYQFALWQTTRAFYGQRCGCNVNLGAGYEHPPCHLHAAYHPSSGRSGLLKNHGGWHDAGDYGRYMVNSGITTGTLLWAWEMYSATLHPLALQIPESGGKVPDFLAEVQWNLEWMLTLQDEDGGVWHKQTSERFASFVMPQDDLAVSYVIGTGAAPYKSTAATADFAAVMAIAARCYSAYAPHFAQHCLAAARRAWKWCQKYPAILFINPPSITTGEYTDKDCQDEILWAAAELWRTTGEEEFHRAFTATFSHSVNPIQVDVPSWNNVRSLAFWSYALANENSADATTASIEAATLTAADQLLKQGTGSGYGATLALEDFVWGSNGIAANHSLLLLLANHFHPKSEWVEGALNNLHYLLGRNCLGVSFVTQVGTRCVFHPHHRPSVADHLALPWPGLLVGGPNAHPADSVSQKLSTQSPMRMYIDNEQAYSCNEVAINWNAPLVFLLAAARSA